MTAAVDAKGRDAETIGLVSTGHFLSHYYLFVLPPLFPIMKEALGVGYTELGLLITAFSVCSGVTQIPVGFLVDRIGARVILIGGIVLEAAAFLVLGLSGVYWVMLVCMAVAGLANSAYHPADYAILSDTVADDRMGRAFSIHTFSGFSGNAVAPLVAVALAQALGWQAAPIAAGVLGFAVALAMLARGEALQRGDIAAGRAARGTRQGGEAGEGPGGMALLLSPPILMCFLFFTMLSMSSGGLSTLGVSALVTIYEIELTPANVALTGFLAASAVGILAGGVIADRTRRHELVASVGFASTAVIVFVIGSFVLPTLLMISLFTLGGLLYGMIMPSRDMLVRAVTPPGSMGKVFGFVSTGLSLGSAVTPILFGWVLDHGDARWLFWGASGFMILALGTVFLAKSTR